MTLHGWPYAAKCNVEHVFITDHIDLYLTFRHKMLRTIDPLASPPVYDVMPELSRWLLDCDGSDIDVVSSVWIDEFTLKLTSDTLDVPPSVVSLEYDGPDIGLCSKWGKQWEPWGPVISDEITSSILNNIYPQRATIWHDESTALTGAPIASYYWASQNYMIRSLQNPGANGDSFSNSFLIKQGTYSIYFLGDTSNDRGILDWSIDGTNIVSSQDWYSSGQTYNVIKTSSNIIITTSGYHVLKGVVNGKNVLSSAYYIDLTKIWLKPSIDPDRI